MSATVHGVGSAMRGGGGVGDARGFVIGHYPVEGRLHEVAATFSVSVQPIRLNPGLYHFKGLDQVSTAVQTWRNQQAYDTNSRAIVVELRMAVGIRPGHSIDTCLLDVEGVTVPLARTAPGVFQGSVSTASSKITATLYASESGSGLELERTRVSPRQPSGTVFVQENKQDPSSGRNLGWQSVAYRVESQTTTTSRFCTALSVGDNPRYHPDGVVLVHPKHERGDKVAI